MLEDKLTIPEAARLAGHTPSYILRMVKGGRITGERKGNFWLLDKASVEAFMATPRPRGGSKKGVPWSKQRQKVETSESAASLSKPLAELVKEAKAPPPASPHAEAPRWQPIDESDPATGLHLQIDALEPGKLFYDASYADRNVQATIHMRPYREGATWYFWDKSYDRVNASAPGRMGGRQESYAKGLLAALEMRMRLALQAAGWQTERSSTRSETWRYAQKREGSQ